MRWRRAPLALLFAVVGVASATDLVAPGIVLQSPAGESTVILEEKATRAFVHTPDGSSHSFPLRRQESLDAVAETGDGWVAVGTVYRSRRNRTQFVVHQESAAGYKRFRGPRTGKRSLLMGGLPLVEDGRLAGMAWLQGTDPRKTRVRVAAWTGARWGRRVTVAPTAAGSQTGLTGAVLDNGDWLLVWSAYDGSDDELLWSLRSGSTWSEPRRLAAGNDVPDVTPSVTAVPGGALVTWSRMEGDEYHLVLARFERGRWSAPREIGGAGSVFARFVRDANGIRLLYKQAFPAAWMALELDERGAVRRRAVIPAAAPGRPALEATAGEIQLRWAGGETAVRRPWEPVP